MNNKIYEADIQKAPIHLVGLQIQNQENLNKYPTYDASDMIAELNTDGDIDIQVFCSLFLDNNFLEQFKSIPTYVYMTALTSNSPEVYLAQQFGKLPTDVGNFMKYAFHIKITSDLIKKFNVNEFRLIGSVTTRNEASVGISESLRVGRFFNTIFPVSNGGFSTNE